MTYIDFARNLTRVSLGLCVLTIVLATLGLLWKDRRFVFAARNSQIAGAFAVVGASLGLIAGFFMGDYGTKYIFSYSESKVDPYYKFAGLWAGLDGSILFWAMILGILAAVVAWQFRRERDHPIGARLEPYVYIVFALVQGFFFMVMVFVADPFLQLADDLSHSNQMLLTFLRNNGLLTPEGLPADGAGLNPLLQNYWMTIHPPMMYAAFVSYTVPFAYAIAALLAGEVGSYWIRKTRRWILIAWLFNTNGIILGSLWAYEVLGWGGYWAWDPVENASFLPWLTGTAFLHSVMIQERRDMLAGWNFFLVALTFFMSIFGTFLTRSGIVSSVHAFASGSVGVWFGWFLVVLVVVPAFLIAFRYRMLRSRHTIDTYFSREAIFLLNNLILVAITLAVVFLTLYPYLTNKFLSRPISVSVPVYNLVCTPLFVVMLLMTAVGPGMGWIRTAPRTIARNLAGPAIVSLPLAAFTQWLAFSVIRGGDLDQPVATSAHLYPSFIVVFAAWLIMTSLAWEVIRAVRSQSKTRGAASALLRLVTLNNRRYGGYIVHYGLATIAIGIVCSSVYRYNTEVQLEKGQRYEIQGGYVLNVGEGEIDEPQGAYISTRVPIEIEWGGRPYDRVEPEKRFYPKTGYRFEEQHTTEVAIARSVSEDFYIYFDHVADGRGYIFNIYRNPLINLVWFGWFLMIFGGIWAALPLGRRRIGLAD